jgi:hypothetical protein
MLGVALYFALAVALGALPRALVPRNLAEARALLSVPKPETVEVAENTA